MVSFCHTASCRQAACTARASIFLALICAQNRLFGGQTWPFGGQTRSFAVIAVFRPATRRSARVDGYWLLAVGCWLLAAGCWLLAVGCWLLAVGCWLLAVGCWLLAVGSDVEKTHAMLHEFKQFPMRDNV